MPWEQPPATGTAANGARHQVVALVHPPQAVFELGCVTEVFGTRRPDLPVRYDVRLCTPLPGPVATTAGYPLLVDEDLSALEHADTVVVPGWTPPRAPVPDTVTQALRRAHGRGARLVGICSGAFVLAATGLLDGRRATTHSRSAAKLAARFPRVVVDPGALYVDHGDVATSSGAAAAVDLLLHLVRGDLGAGYAERIARHMVTAPHRAGGQPQSAGRRPPERSEESLGPLLAWVAGRLDEPMPVPRMAARLGMSPRTLARRFAEQLGTSPGQWLLTQRITAARELLEETDLPVEAVALRVGLSSATNLRRRFHQAVRTTPAAYRKAFRLRERAGS